MRARLTARLAGAACGMAVAFAASLAAHAGPIAADGYTLEFVRKPGAIFDGLARPAGKGPGEPRLENRQGGERRTSIDDEFAACKSRHGNLPFINSHLGFG